MLLNKYVGIYKINGTNERKSESRKSQQEEDAQKIGKRLCRNLQICDGAK